MNLHEHQAKDLLKANGVPVPVGFAAFSKEEAYQAVDKLRLQTGQQVVVVKAQIHAGGRGKGGGVKVAKSADEARAAVDKIWGMQLVTHQTGPAGKHVQRLLLEEGVAIEKELYLAVLFDRKSGRHVVIASTEGGMDIEEVAEKHPEKIIRQIIDPAVGFRPYQAREIAFALGLNKKGPQTFSQAVDVVSKLVVAHHQMDASLTEVNPLVVTNEGRVVALDAKVVLDDNALFRHPTFESLRDASEEDAAELEAKKFDLSYIKLDGTVGCMVNGAGLAMATLDILRYYGGMPANFLDVGGGATVEKVTAAFKIICSDPAVSGILVNIFGGIMKCDTIAQGILTAVKETGLTVPLVVRLEGTNVDLGRKMLNESGLNITPANDMADAAQKIVALAAAHKQTK